jgi:hypothetical protein
MNTEEIEKLVQGSGTKCLASDQLPRDPIKNDIFIVNTDEISKEGTHWVVIAKLGQSMVYADTLGLPPLLKPFVTFINLNMKEGDSLKFNRYPFQDSQSSNCGFYCILLAWHLHQGLSFEDFCQRYGSCAEENDRLLMSDFTRFLQWHKKRERSEASTSQDGSL